MSKKENRHHIIRSIILEKRIHTQQELQSELQRHGLSITQATLSRDIKELNLAKIANGSRSYYTVHNISQTRWKHRLRIYMEDSLVMLQVVQHQVVLKTLPGLAKSFGSIIDEVGFKEIVATVCGDDVCLIICPDHDNAQKCFDILKEYAPPFFFSNNQTES